MDAILAFKSRTNFGQRLVRDSNYSSPRVNAHDVWIKIAENPLKSVPVSPRF